MKKVILAGYYGFGNLGDEAILEMAINQILDITDKKNITVLSGNREVTKNKYNVNTIDRYNVLSIMGKLLKSDALVFGGGSLLQDITSKRSIYYYLFLIRLAKLMNNKVIMLSQGIGPIINETSRKAVQSTLKYIDYITVRDKHSKEYLESIGMNEEKIFLSTDPVINLRAGKNYNSKSSSKKKVCFSLRNWKNADVSGKISELAKMLIEKNIECCFIPFYYKEDLELINDVEKELKDTATYYKEKLTTDEAFDIIRSMDVLVGVRLHSLIFAAAANVPFAAVSYDHKVDHFASSVNMNVSCSIDNIDVISLYNEIIEKIENGDEEKKKLSQSVADLRELIKINSKILKEI